MNKEKIFKIILILITLFVINFFGLYVFRLLYMNNLEKDAEKFIRATVKEMLTRDVKQGFEKHASSGLKNGYSSTQYEFDILPVLERTGEFEKFVILDGNIQIEKDYNNQKDIAGFYSGKAKFKNIYTYCRFVLTLEEEGWKYQLFKIQP